MKFTIQDASTLDPAALADELVAALGSNFGISTAGTEITTNGVEPDAAAFQAVLDTHVANAIPRKALKDCITNRVREYPPMTDYLDGIVKGSAVQQQTYINACLAVKAKYPKP